MKFEYDADGKAVSQILLEVDDFIVTALPSHEKQVEEELRRRFTFGKWEKGAAEYGGRRVRTFHDKVLIDQGKYIREQVRPVPLEKNRKQDRNRPPERDRVPAPQVSHLQGELAGEGKPTRNGRAGIDNGLETLRGDHR